MHVHIFNAANPSFPNDPEVFLLLLSCVPIFGTYPVEEAKSDGEGVFVIMTLCIFSSSLATFNAEKPDQPKRPRDEVPVARDEKKRTALCSYVQPQPLLTPSPTNGFDTHQPSNQKQRKQTPVFSYELLISLLLLSLLLLSLLPGPLLALASVALVGALVAQLAEGTALDGLGQLGLLDLGDGRGDGGDGEGGARREDGVLNGLEVLLGRVGLLGLVGLLGEEDQAGGVGLEALDVGGEGLLGDVLAARVDGDADGRGVLAGDAGGLGGFPVSIHGSRRDRAVSTRR